MFGSHSQDKTSIAQTLQGLMDQLSAPDLTMVEAQNLRPVLFKLLNAIEADVTDCVVPEMDRPADCFAVA